MSGAPENEATETKCRGGGRRRSSSRTRPVRARRRPCPSRVATVRRLASIHGISWSTWNVSHCDGPSGVVGVDPVGEPPATVAVEAGVGHHDDQRQARRSPPRPPRHSPSPTPARSCRGTGRARGSRAVGLAVVRGQRMRTSTARRGRRRDRDVVLARVEPGDADDVDAGGVVEGDRWLDRQGSGTPSRRQHRCRQGPRPRGR